MAELSSHVQGSQWRENFSGGISVSVTVKYQPTSSGWLWFLWLMHAVKGHKRPLITGFTMKPFKCPWDCLLRLQCCSINIFHVWPHYNLCRQRRHFSFSIRLFLFYAPTSLLFLLLSSLPLSLLHIFSSPPPSSILYLWAPHFKSMRYWADQCL